MFSILLEYKLLTGIMLFSLLLSIICQIVVGVIFQSMIVETDNMSVTKNKLLKQCKQKYAGYYKLNGSMANTGVFVDRFLQKVCFAKMNLTRLTHLAGQLIMLFILAIGIAICALLASGKTLFQIIPYYLVSILGLYVYFSIAGLMDIPEKKSIVKTNLMDYLENHLAPRLQVEKELVGEQSQYDAEDIQKNHENRTTYLDSENKKRGREQAENIEELENLLEEFFA